MSLTPAQKNNILILQKEELNGYFTYLKLAGTVKDEHNSQILNRIARKN